MWSVCTVSLALLCGNAVSAKLFKSVSELTKVKYDFVIVGGGTAGSVIASRLSEDPTKSVLVIEAGVDNANISNIIVPFFGPQALNTIVDWNFTTTPQPGLLNRSIAAARGHVLGGSSSINYMAWNRGSNDVWDNLARLSKDNGWSWKSVEKYNLKSSRLVPPADHHDTTGQVIPAAHGYGPVLTSLPGFPTQLDPLVSGTAKSLKQYNMDHNAGNMLGYGFFQSAIGNGERSSSATAYLVPALKRPNLDVLINTRATKLLASKPPTGPGQRLTIDMLQIVKDANSAPLNITASKEIILSAGAYGTPQLLLLSGIGPREDFIGHNIPVILESPDVGRHLADHPLLANYYVVNSTSTSDPILRDPETQIPPLLAQWEANRTGILTTTGSGNMVAFLKNPSQQLTGFDGDPSSGPGSGNIELIFSNSFRPLGTLPLPDSGSYMTIITAVVSPTSRGTLTLRSTDPFEQPAIDPGYYSTDYDIQSMLQAMKVANNFISQPLWNGYVIKPFVDLPTDADKEVFARNNSITVNHPVGTARMGPGGVTGGVVDSEFRVKGVKGLRVVDASVFPQIPECHPQALVYILAERASDLIKGTS